MLGFSWHANAFGFCSRVERLSSLYRPLNRLSRHSAGYKHQIELDVIAYY